MYKKFRFINEELAGDIFYPSSARAKPKAAGIFLYGLPAFIGQNEVTYSLINANLVSFQPHYLGTYDSGGLYSPQSVVETCRHTQSIFTRGVVEQTTKDDAPYSLPPLRLAVGHSFGTLALLRGVRHLTTITTLVLLAPTVHYGRGEADFGNKADGLAILRSIRLAHPFTYRLAPPETWYDLLTGNDALPVPADHPTLKEVIAVGGEDDPYLDWKPLERNLPRIVRAYCGDRVKLKIVRVPSAGHNLAELVEPRRKFSLSDIARNC